MSEIQALLKTISALPLDAKARFEKVILAKYKQTNTYKMLMKK